MYSGQLSEVAYCATRVVSIPKLPVLTSTTKTELFLCPFPCMVRNLWGPELKHSTNLIECYKSYSYLSEGKIALIRIHPS